MERRTELHKILEKILGSKNVYFQPPSSLKIHYPCIVYERSPSHRRFADNNQYTKIDRYTLTVIDRNSDTDIPDKISELLMVKFDRCYVADNLNHYVFTINH